MNQGFSKTQTLTEFQDFIDRVYGLADDPMYSLSDILTNQQRFTRRALKGIRKNDQEKLKLNLLIALSWLVASANRLHINLEEKIWQRFPMLCSYCGQCPCVCKKTKPTARAKMVIDESKKPKNLAEIQTMFEKIYPIDGRTLTEAGVHLAEEMGEISEAVHVFLGEHKEEQFSLITDEFADYVSCIIGVANSAGINMAEELSEMYASGCHACHQSPCQCQFSFVAKFNS